MNDVILVAILVTNAFALVCSCLCLCVLAHFSRLEMERQKLVQQVIDLRHERDRLEFEIKRKRDANKRENI